MKKELTGYAEVRCKMKAYEFIASEWRIGDAQGRNIQSRFLTRVLKQRFETIKVGTKNSDLLTSGRFEARRIPRGRDNEVALSQSASDVFCKTYCFF